MTEKPELTLEELTDFLQSPGWRWFALECAKEWGDAAFGVRVAKSISNTDPGTVGEVIRQWTATKGAIDRLFALPKQKMESLKQQKATVTAATRPDRRPVGV